MQKEKQTKPKASRKEIIKIKMQANEIDNRKTAEKSNITKIQFLKKISKTDISSQIKQEKERKNLNYQNQKWKEEALLPTLQKQKP